MNSFYSEYPNFDWKYYISIYPDLQTAGIKTEQGSIKHYITYGKNENRKTHFPKSSVDISNLKSIELENIFKLINVNHCFVSKGLDMFKSRFLKKFNLVENFNKKQPCVFFGVYTDEDINKIIDYSVNNICIIIYGGSDVNIEQKHSMETIKVLLNLNNIIHVCISKCLYSRLKTVGINSIYTNLNLVDRNLFKPVENKIREDCNSIFIFNGQTKGRESLYGKEYYTQVVDKLRGYNFDYNFDFIYSNTLNESYENMPNIYKKCFIMLRLTKYDGNANSVQECEAMNIPVIHNNSDYGIKWENVDDIIKIIIEKKIIS